MPFFRNDNHLIIAKEFNQNGKTTKDAILEINIEFQHIKIQEVDSMNLVALMANMNPDQNFWNKIGGYLRSSNDFNKFEDFFSYHVCLIKYIWQKQLKFDDLFLIIPTFIFMIEESKGILLPAERFEKLPLEGSSIQ